MNGCLQDLRHGLPAPRPNPGFAITAIVCPALGTGANTAIFGAVNAVVARAHSQPVRLAPSMINVIHELDPELPVRNVITLEDFIDDSLTDSRCNRLLLTSKEEV